MPSVIENILFFVTITQLVLGVVGNGFIGLVNCIDCVKNKRFSMLGCILTGLAISRICLIWFIIFDGVIKFFSPDMYTSSDLVECFSYLAVIIHHLNIWFATSLSIYYFLKIANFSHYIFLWLKRRINRVFTLLIGCLFMSWLLTFPQVAKGINDSKMKYRNTSWLLHLGGSEFLLHQIFLNLGVTFFFTVSLIACFLLIISLWRHKSQMQLNNTAFRDLNTEAHVKAMKVLTSFLILFILHVIGIIIEVACGSAPENKVLFSFGFIITAIYPWGHSLILILGNSKLKQACWKALQQLKCCNKGKTLRASQ
uniref:Taste receptor type 2 n=1 Tax=Sciurus vulgaris TaxID=55149 RepID=A0A8D2CLI9_SCIVU